MRLLVTTPRGPRLDREVLSVVLEGGLGELGILPGHAPLQSTAEIGVLRYETPEGPGELAIGQGALEVLGDRITVLCKTCEASEEIDQERARRALERAKALLEKALVDPSVDRGRADLALRRAQARLHAAHLRRHP